MGAETSVVLALIFSVFLIIGTVTYSSVDYSKNLVKDAQNDQDTMEKNKLQTDITITNVSFLNNSGNVYLNITIKNTGKTTLDASLLDIFVNGIYYDSSYCISARNTWVPKNSTNISVYSIAAPITYDNTTSTSVASASSITWQHTVGQSLRNSLLVVGVSMASNDAVTSITYAGVNLIRANSSWYYWSSQRVRAEIWYLTNPKAGANNIVVTFPSAIAAYAGAVSFSGVDQTNPIPTTATGSGLFPPPSTSITTANANAWIIDTEVKYGQIDDVPTPPQTLRWWRKEQSLLTGAGSTRNTTTAGPYTMNWTIWGQSWAQVVAEINPAICNKPTTGRIKVVTENGLWDYAIAS